MYCMLPRWHLDNHHARRDPISHTQIPSRAYAFMNEIASLRLPHSNSRLSLTHFRTLFLNSGVLSRHKLAASTFAGDSSFGLDSMEMTERRMVSGV
jgi:hypothetical protein